MKIHLATDHAGLEIKNEIKMYLSNGGHHVIDHGAYEYDPLDDYPDFIFFPVQTRFLQILKVRELFWVALVKVKQWLQIALRVSVLLFIMVEILRSLNFQEDIMMQIYYQ